MGFHTPFTFTLRMDSNYTPPPCSTYRVTHPMQRPTRRQFVVSATGTSLAALAGLGILSQPTQAVSVDVNELKVRDPQTVSSADPIESLPLTIQGEWAYEANTDVSHVKLVPKLEIEGSAATPHEFSMETVDVSGQAATGEFAIERELTDVYDLREPFPTTEGETNTFAVTLSLEIGVYDGDTLIGQASASQQWTLEVAHEQASATIGLTATAFVGDE